VARASSAVDSQGPSAPLIWYYGNMFWDARSGETHSMLDEASLMGAIGRPVAPRF
jgi:hypothetical protein